MNVYVVRYIERVDGEERCQNFDNCFTDKREAAAAMLADYRATKLNWENNERYEQLVCTSLGGDDDVPDFASIQDETPSGTYDYANWYVDNLNVIED